jgi:hypothetical protein
LHFIKTKTPRILQDIRSLRKQNKPDEEIRNTLGIKYRMWVRYVKRLHEEDKEIWRSLVSNELESELLRLRSSLEDTYRIASNMAENGDEFNKLEACKAKDDARLSIVQLLKEGPDYINENIQEKNRELATQSETTKNISK